MIEIDRVLVVIKPKQSFITWLNQQGIQVTLEEASEDASAYLIPVFEDDADIDEYLAAQCQSFVELELYSWNIEDDNHNLIIESFDTFKHYFKIELHSIIYDTVTTDYAMPLYSSETIQ